MGAKLDMAADTMMVQDSIGSGLRDAIFFPLRKTICR